MRLTIDVGLQRAAERAIRDGIELARQQEEFNANGGAIVALDPRDGAVLAMASNPTYKPSVYVGRVDPKKLEPLTIERVAKERNYPGINRAIAGVYPPGSTFKPLTALAAISDELLSPYEYIQCTPFAEYGLDEHRFDNWNPFMNAPMSLTTALAQSCDTYFYDVGNRYYTRGEHERKYWTAMQAWARKFGFGQAPGLDIGGEATGLLPTPAWRKKTYKGIDRAWNPGDLIQMAIGQKDITVTPLQMARFYAALANGGNLVTPYIVSSIEQPSNDGSPPVPLDTFPPSLRSRSRSTRSRSPSSVTASIRRPTTPRAPRPASSAASRCRSPARPVPRRRSFRCPAIRSITWKTRRGGAAGARSTGTST